MADVRVQPAFKLVDPTNNAQGAGVDAGGNLQVIAASNTGVDIGDVDVTSIIPGVGATNLGKAVDSAAGSTDTGAALLAVRDDALAGLTPAEGDYTQLLVDASGALWVNISAGTVSISGTVTVDSELPAAASLTDNFANPTAPAVGAFTMLWDGATWDRAPGTAADGMLVNTELPTAAALADATSNPTVPGVGGFLMGFNGTTWDRVRTANTGRLQVDVLSGASGEPAPTGATASETTSSSVAAGGSANLDSAEAAEAENLAMVTCTSSVPFKAVLQTLASSTVSTIATFFGRAGETVQFKPPHRTYVSLTTSGGTDVFRVVMTNLDTSEAADMYASFFYQNN